MTVLYIMTDENEGNNSFVRWGNQDNRKVTLHFFYGETPLFVDWCKMLGIFSHKPNDNIISDRSH